MIEYRDDKFLCEFFSTIEPDNCELDKQKYKRKLVGFFFVFLSFMFICIPFCQIKIILTDGKQKYFFQSIRFCLCVLLELNVLIQLLY